jgi:hypothetical protein
MKKLIHLILTLAVVITVLPNAAYGATSRPTCELEVTTPMGSVTIDDKSTVLLQKGEVVKIEWESSNAKKATDSSGDSIPLEGLATSSPKKTTSYIYTFTSGSKKEVCSVKVVVVEGGFKDGSVVTETRKPQISGTALGVKSVILAIYKKGEEETFYKSKTIAVKNGKWSTKITRNLAKGEYKMVLLGKNADLNIIDKGTLTIGKKANKDQTTFVAESVPLLVGGVIKNAGSASVAYIQTINIGKATGTVESITLTQKGNAQTSAIKGFTVTDNKSTTNVTFGSDLEPVVFKEGSVTIPLSTPIKGGDMRLFTIKVLLTNTATTNLGKHIKLDVSGIQTSGLEKMVLPIKGIAWTIGM